VAYPDGGEHSLSETKAGFEGHVEPRGSAGARSRAAALEVCPPEEHQVQHGGEAETHGNPPEQRGRNREQAACEQQRVPGRRDSKDDGNTGLEEGGLRRHGVHVAIFGGSDGRPGARDAKVLAAVLVAAVLGLPRAAAAAAAGIAATKGAVVIRHCPPQRGSPRSVGHLDPALAPWSTESAPSRLSREKGRGWPIARLFALSQVE